MAQPQPTDLETRFREVVRSQYPRLRRIARSYAPLGEHEDLLQDILAQVWRSLPRFDDRAQLSTWVYRVALNTALGALRSRYAAPGAACHAGCRSHATGSDRGGQSGRPGCVARGISGAAGTDRPSGSDVVAGRPATRGDCRYHGFEFGRLQREVTYHRSLRWRWWLPFTAGLMCALVPRLSSQPGIDWLVLLAAVVGCGWGMWHGPRHWPARLQPEVARLHAMLDQFPTEPPTGRGDAA